MSGRKKPDKEKLAEPMHCWVNRAEADRIHRDVKEFDEQHGITITVSDACRRYLRLGMQYADLLKAQKAKPTT